MHLKSILASVAAFQVSAAVLFDIYIDRPGMDSVSDQQRVSEQQRDFCWPVGLGLQCRGVEDKGPLTGAKFNAGAPMVANSSFLLTNVMVDNR